MLLLLLTATAPVGHSPILRLAKNSYQHLPNNVGRVLLASAWTIPIESKELFAFLKVYRTPVLWLCNLPQRISGPGIFGMSA